MRQTGCGELGSNGSLRCLGCSCNKAKGIRRGFLLIGRDLGSRAARSDEIKCSKSYVMVCLLVLGAESVCRQDGSHEKRYRPVQNMPSCVWCVCACICVFKDLLTTVHAAKQGKKDKKETVSLRLGSTARSGMEDE